jgi:predicted GIY-YIG superfamily endonuclease
MNECTTLPRSTQEPLHHLIRTRPLLTALLGMGLPNEPFRDTDWRLYGCAWEENKGCPVRCKHMGRLCLHEYRRDSLHNDALQWLYYVVNLDGEIIYVGITGMVSNRVRLHKKGKVWWPEADRIMVAKIKPAEAHATEKYEIKRLRPKYNVAHKDGYPR